ncbi:retrovirus-related pol polyprotein from transposon TNT 1-94 [Tanacetum coccineum]
MESDSQGGSYEDIDEEEAEAFNLLTRNFYKFFLKDNQFGRVNQFGNRANRFGKGRENSFGNQGEESSKPKGACYNCGIEGNFASECRKPKENKDFVGGAWSDSKDDDEHQNDATCLMAINSQEVCLKCDLLPDDWIVDSGCTKHMTGNRRFFTLYKAYDGRKVIFWSNLMGKVVGGGNDSIKSKRLLIRSRCVRVFGYILQELKKINLKKHEVKRVQQSCLGEDCWELFIPDLVPNQSKLPRNLAYLATEIFDSKKAKIFYDDV